MDQVSGNPEAIRKLFNIVKKAVLYMKKLELNLKMYN